MYNILPNIRERSQEENIHPQKIHLLLFQDAKLINYTTRARNSLKTWLIDTY